MESRRLPKFLICCVLFSLVGGCSWGPSAPSRPSLDPGEAGKLAISEYDANGDGAIDKTEAEKSPGMLDAFERIDKDGDGSLTADEIADRVRYYKTANTTIVSGSVTVTFRGRPLPGAKVVFEPESFLGGAFTNCEGTTNDGGIALLEGPDAEFPGIYLGMYRVRITRQNGGSEMIPAKYNTETTLGYEAADDIQGVSRGITFDLTK